MGNRTVIQTVIQIEQLIFERNPKIALPRYYPVQAFWRRGIAEN
jgi:hypothetical protein